MSEASRADSLSAATLPAFIALMIDRIHLSFPFCLLCPAGPRSQRGDRVRGGRAAGGNVLRQAQYAPQHSDWPLGTRPFRNQELREDQGGRAAVLPGGEQTSR